MATHQKQERTFTFRHPQLGSMTGIVTPENVVQFRAVPYATHPARFKHSVLLENLDSTSRDFTKRGYACPQNYPNHAFSGGPFPNQSWPPIIDELNSLILQINVPLACLEDSSSRLSNLPVLIYIHGGGFVLGHIDDQHNTALMVEQSLLDSQPIISASIQYRLGALGFMRTPEGESNFGFYDQRTALLWIQKFIRGFGGDEGNVTTFGESAGSMSICYHMLAPAPASGPLFKRAVLMSGVVAPSTAPIPIPEAEKMYERLVQTLGIEERGEAALGKLRELDVQTIVDASVRLSDQGTMWVFVHDPNWYGEKQVTWDKIPGLIGQCDWVDEIMLGTTGFEGTMFANRVNALTPANFSKALTQQLGERSASLLLKAYNITPSMDQNLFITSGFRWIGDCIFDAPTQALAKHLSTNTNKKVYRYIFDVRNPFPNSPLYQTAHHWVDVYFVFKTYQFRYPSQKLKNISTKHAQLWINFANGRAPWKEYKYGDGSDATVMVADERDGWVERSVAEDERITELSWERPEALWKSWTGMAGKWFSPLKIEPLEGMGVV